MALSQKLKTKIFLDSGDPAETKKAIEILGHLDGQTTNPSLVARNPEINAKFEAGEKLSKDELLSEYRKIVNEVSEMLPNGSVSIEVYADENTTAEEMVEQAKEMNSWIPNAHIKLPTITEGLKAERMLLDMGMKVNMTLVFSQNQAAAIAMQAKNIQKGDVFVSPFLGRLDDIGKDGMDLIKNILQMYQNSESKVEVLAASIRSVEHIIYTLYLETDIITIPFKMIEAWNQRGLPLPGVDLSEEDLKNENEFFAEIKDDQINDIPYEDIDMNADWMSLDIKHELTDKGLAKFAEDWNKLLA